MEVNLRHLANRVKTDKRLLTEHPENKEMLERRLETNKQLIIDHVIENYAD